MLRKFTAISALVAAALSVGGADAKHFHIKVFSEKAATVTAADTTASSGSSSTGVSAGDSSNPNTWHMKQVTSIQARVQGDAPVWDGTAKAYLSKYGSTAAEKYRSVLDTVNTASVEGALMYVQAEGINVNEQSVKCERKNNMQYVVFYEITIVQPTYAIAAYQSNYTEFCNDGGVEFDATNTGSGFTVKKSLPFWENPGNETANTERFEKMVALFNKEAPNAKVGTMTPLPEIADLVKANPKCYENSEQCAKAKNGCRRTLYSQVCEVCSSAGDGCEVAPSSFTYPTLIAATPAPGVSSDSGSGSGISSDDAGTTSSAMTASSAFASVALAFSVALAALL